MSRAFSVLKFMCFLSKVLSVLELPLPVKQNSHQVRQVRIERIEWGLDIEA